MLGLISALTPILYKQVTERREEIDNINEANKLLLLKEATERYIEENKDTLSVGSMVIDPLDVGIDISGYSIGIKKDSEGNVDTMIVGNANNDLQAAKIASLLGVSAGIYSAQDTTKAWGINGVWAEDISNYGLSSIPTGVPVVTTAYDKETSNGINEEQLKEIIENTSFTKFSADEFCLGGECITEWIEATATPLQLIINCNMGDKKSCQRAYQKGKINYNCEAIGKTFKENDGSAQSGLYTFSLDESTYTQNNLCFFINNQAVTAETIITECNNDGSSEYCRLGYTYNINRSCEEIIKTNPSASTGFYNLTTASSASLQPCAFTGNRIATSLEVVNLCNSSNNAASAACRYGWNNNINRSCSSITSLSSAKCSTSNIITTASSGSKQTCSCCPSAGSVVLNRVGTYTAQCPGNYEFSVQNTAGSTTWYRCTHTGYTTLKRYAGTGYFSAGTVFTLASAGGSTDKGNDNSCCRSYPATGGTGYGIKANGNWILTLKGNDCYVDSSGNCSANAIFDECESFAGGGAVYSTDVCKLTGCTTYRATTSGSGNYIKYLGP